MTMLTPREILDAIDANGLQANDSERNYLGASVIGEACQRKLWLQFHRYVVPEKFEPRMLRLFRRGKLEEYLFQGYLESIGMNIINNCDDQEGFSDGFFGGHGDGVFEYQGMRVAAEYKTHNDKSFKMLVVGSLNKSHPKHYAQAQVYMGKFKCKYCIYLAVNKNDDELFCDVLEFDEGIYSELCAKAEYVTMSDKPPPRIASKPTAFDCKFCHAHDVCWGFEMPRVECRNCTSATKHQDYGSFGCDMIAKDGAAEQRISNIQLDLRGYCESHSFNPYAMNELQGWEPLEFYPEYRAVKYKKPDGTEIINGKFPFGIESKDLK